MSNSTVTLVGNITRDPELRYTAGGMAVAGFGIAVSRKQGDKEVTSFFDVQVFGQLGENVAESLAKGQRVIVAGRLDQRSWETAEGDRRSKVEVVADAVGPDLRFAKAVERVAAGAARGARRGSSNDYDEEPL